MRHRLPEWLRQIRASRAGLHLIKQRLRNGSLHTVCEEARCPNIGECFARPTAAFMLMGNICTRNCGFCNLTSGRPAPLDILEPEKVSEAAAALKLRHVVLTSVTRDDLPLGGAPHFCRTAAAIKRRMPQVTVEILTPDFQGEIAAWNEIATASIDVFNHNLETIKRLYPEIRPGADYRRSLDFLKFMTGKRPEVLGKSGFMLGLGEETSEVEGLLQDLRAAGAQAITIGQYLQPRLGRCPVVRYVPPPEFDRWKEHALAMGYQKVASGPLVRSSYFADQMVESSI